MFEAILSTTVLPVDGCYRVRTVHGQDRQNVLRQIPGVDHYIHHPATRDIVEGLGAIVALNSLFAGLEVGQQAVCLSIAQGRSSRVDLGFTVHQEISDFDFDIEIRVITRLSDPGQS